MVRTFELVPSPPHAHAHAQVTSFFPFLITVSMHVGKHLVDPSLIYHSGTVVVCSSTEQISTEQILARIHGLSLNNTMRL